MVHALFADFLESEEKWEACEGYWRNLAEDVATSLGQPSWTQWMSKYYADGKSLIDRDLRAMYSMRSEELDRAFRILQFPPEGNDEGVVMAAWLKRYEDEYTELPRDELVINLTLSEESEPIARELLRLWMAPATTPAQMESFIRQRIGPLSRT